MLVMQIVWNIL